MKRWLVGCSLALYAGAALWACASDDTIAWPGPDGGAVDASVDSTVPISDAGSTSDAGSAPPWLLLSVGGSVPTTDMVAYSLPKRAVDGRITYDGFGTTYVDGPVLWLLRQQGDIVRKLDPSAPWRGGPSWNVAAKDRADGGANYADPIAVVAGPAGKAYVLLFNRNLVAVIDPTQNQDPATPLKTIDLSRFVDPADGDGTVDLSGAVYLPARKRLYLLLGNFDLTSATDGYIKCNAEKPSLVAIDVDSDTVVPGAISFGGYEPVFGALHYDAPRDRFLVLSAGCNDPGDAGPGALHKRQIDAIDPNTGAAETVLDLTGQGYPLAHAQTDANHWAIGFGAQAYAWDVTSSSLGSAIAGAPSLFAYDGQQSLVGTTTDYFADGGSATSVVSVRLDDGGTTSYGPAPISPGQYIGSVDSWSR